MKITAGRTSNKFNTVKVFIVVLILSPFLLLQFSSCARQQKQKDDILKIFMLWDMEGASAVFDQQRIWYWDPGVPKELGVEGCEMLTADVNNAVRAAFEAGVDTVIVCDTHHGGNNIIPEKLIRDPRVRFLPRSVGVENGKWRWMPYLDESVDGFMVMAHHAKAGTQGAFLPHTQNLGWEDFLINGQSVGEMGIESCYAGHWNIPVIMMSGDDFACREAAQQFPGIITAQVKKAEAFDRCTGPNAEEAHKLMADKMKEAIKKLKEGGSYTIYQPALPMVVTLRVSEPEIAQRLSDRYGAKRIDSLTLQDTVGRHCDVIQWLTNTGLDMPEPTKR
jgi:D-amino peptidase